MATIIGYVCSDIYFVYYLVHKSQNLSLNIHNVHVNSHEIGQIFMIGLPASITNLMQTIGVAMTNRYLLPYGNDTIAMMGIVLKIVNIATLVIVGFAFGGQPLIGYNYGAQKKERLKTIIRFAYGTAGVLALVISGLLMIFGPLIVSRFVTDPVLIDKAVPMLRLQLAGLLFMSTGLITICVFQSTGKAIPSFLISVCRQGVIYFLVLWLASAWFGYAGVLSSQAISDLISAWIALVLFRMTIYSEIS